MGINELMPIFYLTNMEVYFKIFQEKPQIIKKN